METLKFVIIGSGAGVLNMHRPALALEHIRIVGVHDRNPERGVALAAELNALYFDDYKEMLREADGDVALIVTTHPSHMEIAIDCFAAGYHVLVEKPMAIQVKEADRMIQAARKADRKLGVCFQRRYTPSVLAAKEIIDTGALGEIQYAHMSIVWTRPQRYFTEKPWRGTWSGEGGGVLVNQAPHNLDMLCFLLGLPKIVKAWTRVQFHAIETEDTAHAMFQWGNGAYGSFHVSTAEAGPENHLEIRGTKGYLIFTGFELKHVSLDRDIRDYVRDASSPYAQPLQHEAPLLLDGTEGDHIALYRDFTNAILHDSHLLVDGESSRMSLELANAIVYSSHTREELDLPLDVEQYADLLADKQKTAYHPQ